MTTTRRSEPDTDAAEPARLPAPDHDLSRARPAAAARAGGGARPGATPRRSEGDPDAAEPAGLSVPDVEIRRARTAELGAVGQLTLAAYSYDGFAHADYASRLSDAATRDREAEIWVAATPDKLLGCVTYCPPGSPWR